MKLDYLIRPAARGDIDDAYAWYEEQERAAVKNSFPVVPMYRRRKSVPLPSHPKKWKSRK